MFKNPPGGLQTGTQVQVGEEGLPCPCPRPWGEAEQLMQGPSWGEKDVSHGLFARPGEASHFASPSVVRLGQPFLSSFTRLLPHSVWAKTPSRGFGESGSEMELGCQVGGKLMTAVPPPSSTMYSTPFCCILCVYFPPVLFLPLIPPSSSPLLLNHLLFPIFQSLSVPLCLSLLFSSYTSPPSFPLATSISCRLAHCSVR